MSEEPVGPIEDVETDWETWDNLQNLRHEVLRLRAWLAVKPTPGLPARPLRQRYCTVCGGRLQPVIEDSGVGDVTMSMYCEHDDSCEAPTEEEVALLRLILEREWSKQLA